MTDDERLRRQNDRDRRDGVWISRYWLVALLVLPTIFLGSTFIAAYWTHTSAEKQRAADARRADRHLCNEVETLKRKIRIIIARSDKTIDTNSYFIAHPNELPVAHRLNARALRDLRARDCTRLATGTHRGS